MSDVTRLIVALGSWRQRPGAQYERLADALAAVIERGGLDGMPLPAERRFADALEVSRSTVVRAYALLRERRLVASRERSRTVVRSVGRRGRAPGTQLPQLGQLLAPRGPEGAAGRGASARAVGAAGAGGVHAAAPGMRAGAAGAVAEGGASPSVGVATSPATATTPAIDLAVAAPRLDELVAGIHVGLGDAAGLAAPHGYDPQGMPALREAIAARLSADGTPATPDDVLVTNGAHEALSLIGALFVGRGQPIAVDAPTYPGALELFERAGGRPVAVAGDAAGMRPDALRALLSRTVTALVYLMPGCHSPTGVSIALGRRPALLAVAEQHDVLVVEDAALDKLRFDGPLPSLRSLAPTRVLRVGSLDKLAWAGLRVGWICGPPELIGRLARMKAARDLGAGVLGQLAALSLLRDVDALRTARVAQARSRAALLRDELSRQIPAWRIAMPEGGWSLWADWDAGGRDGAGAGDGAAARYGAAARDGAAAAGIDGDALAAAAVRHGVHVAPGRPHFPAGGGEPVTAVRIAYAADESTLVEGAARLAAAWAELTGHLARPRRGRSRGTSI